jgi:hypothetical protein
MPEEANTARQVGSREVRLASAAEHSRNVSREVVLRSRSRGKIILKNGVKYVENSLILWVVEIETKGNGWLSEYIYGWMR